MSIQPINTVVLGERRKSKGKKAVSAYLIKNSKGEGGGGGGAGGGGGTLTISQKDWVELYGCIKWVSNDQSLQWQSLENLSLSLFP